MTFAWVALAWAAWAAGSEPAPVPALRPGQPIAGIVVERHNVFDLDDSSQDNRLFRLADGIHSMTREGVIRRELLFSVGDPYTPGLLSETERNLRRLPFIRKVEVSAVATSSGPVVLVRAWDSWTLELAGNFKRAGGVSTAGLGVADSNVLGFGKGVGAAYTKNASVVSRSVSYDDPQFLRSRANLNLSAAEASDSRHYGLNLSRPFYATIARSAVSVSGEYSEGRISAYQGLVPVGTIERRNYDSALTYGYALEASLRRTRRLSVSLENQHADYLAVPDQTTLFVPQADQHTSLVLAYDYQETSFIKQKRIQKLSRDEDFNMGWGVSPSIGYAPRSALLGSTGEKIEPKLDVRKGFSSELGQFLFLRGAYLSTYVNGGNGGRVATLEANYFCRYFPRNTLAARALLDHGWRLDGYTQLKLGEDSGLRGYRAEQFTGNRRLLFNVEDRIFFFEDAGHLLDAGGVLFFDSGYVWMPEEAFRFDDLKSSVGFGLRLGATRSSTNEPLRIDVAHALNDNHFPTRWTLLIQAGVAFGPQ